MAKLNSLRDDIFFELISGEKEIIDSEIWQNFDLKFNCYWLNLYIKSYSKNHNNLSIINNKDKFDIINSGTVLLCRKPQDELVDLKNLLIDLCQSKCDNFSFEPIEPSFEIVVKTNDRNLNSFNAEISLDLTNFLDGNYLGDSICSKFYTSLNNLKLFVKELESIIIN